MLRFAPSPTGNIHIGNLRIALLNYIISKQKDSKYILRIEDTDDIRNIKDADKNIINILSKFNIKYDQIIYQSNNLLIHRKLATKLLSEGKAFCCFCSDEVLEEKREEAKKQNKPYRYDGTCLKLKNSDILNDEGQKFVVRITPSNENITVNDLIRGKHSFSPFDIDSFIILRQDKKPTYNYACAVDDMISNVTTIIRGEDHYSNSAKQKHIHKQLGYDKDIEYIHLPLITDKVTGKKMSKRDEMSSVNWLLNNGYLVEAITNYLILIGYNPTNEIFNIEEAIKWFDVTKISKSSAKFDIDKLNYINREHIKLKDDIQLLKIAGYDTNKLYIAKLIKLYCEEGSTLIEIKAKIDKFFSVKKETLYENQILKLKNIIQNFDKSLTFEQFKNELMKKSELSGKQFFKPLRYLITGSYDGPSLQKIYNIVNKELKDIV